jgi:hypothetical protein
VFLPSPLLFFFSLFLLLKQQQQMQQQKKQQQKQQKKKKKKKRGQDALATQGRDALATRPVPWLGRPWANHVRAPTSTARVLPGIISGSSGSCVGSHRESCSLSGPSGALPPSERHFSLARS